MIAIETNTYCISTESIVIFHKFSSGVDWSAHKSTLISTYLRCELTFNCLLCLALLRFECKFNKRLIIGIVASLEWEMPSERNIALMRYTLISVNVLIIILVSLSLVRGLLNIKDKSYLESFSTDNISINTTRVTSAKSLALIFGSLLRTSNAVLGLWAGIKLSFTLLIVYGIVSVVSLVLSITIGLGADEYGTTVDYEEYSLGAFYIFVGIFLALLAFRLGCLTKRGIETDIEADNGSEFQEEEQNQCEIV